MNTLEQMVETWKWWAMWGVEDTDGKCILCGQHDETVQHLLAGCEMLAGAEYLSRHNALMVLAVNWAIEKGHLPGSTVWYGEKWKKGCVLKEKQFKLCKDFVNKMRKTSTVCRLDMTLDDVREKIWIVDMLYVLTGDEHRGSNLNQNAKMSTTCIWDYGEETRIYSGCGTCYYQILVVWRRQA